MTEPRPVIDLRDVSYAYPKGNGQVLRDVRLSVRKNELLAVMGKTGAGKTTLLTLLNGLIPHFYEGELKGEVLVAGLNTRLYHVQTLATRVGFVLQDVETQIVGVTVESDVAFGPCNLGFPREQIRRSTQNALASAGLAGFERRAPAQLSGGERQRLAIAGILAMEPRVLVLDEPTGELDPQARRELFHLLRRLKEESGYTILLATHDSEEVLAHADRVVVVNEGRIVWEGAPRELFVDTERCRGYGIKPLPIATLLARLTSEGISVNGSLPLNVKEAADALGPQLRRDSLAEPVPQPEVPPQEIGATIIQVENLHHTYTRKSDALKGVDLTLRRGEFVALVGKNGAGKSTLVKHFNGLLKPTAGRVLVKGWDTRMTPTSTLSRHVGYVFQNPDHQIFCPSVREELRFGLLQTHTLTEYEIAERVKMALGFVGMEHLAGRHPFTLGKGERQKLAVASVLAIEPDILVIDEPTTGLDWEDTVRMMDLIRRLHRKGHTILIITHDMALAAEHAGRIIIMSGGLVIADGPPEEVFLMPGLLERAALAVPPMAGLALALRQRGAELPFVREAEMTSALAVALKGTPA